MRADEWVHESSMEDGVAAFDRKTYDATMRWLRQTHGLSDASGMDARSYGINESIDGLQRRARNGERDIESAAILRELPMEAVSC